MSASLVGSEMCIRDSCAARAEPRCPDDGQQGHRNNPNNNDGEVIIARGCLLYTSDAADDM
eukprot:9866404-Alexandrium_andersonii.AAC.1